MRSRPRIPFAIALLTVGLGLTLASGPAAAAKKDDTSKAQLKFGVEMARRELWSEALFRFRRAAALDPGNAHVFNNLAVACEATGNFDEALENYRQALKLSPNDRALRGNYSRFVEFYRGFKPEEPADADAAGTDATGTDAAAGAASAVS